MAQELQAAALDSVKAVLGRGAPKHALPVGAACPNCAAPLAGALAGLVMIGLYEIGA